MNKQKALNMQNSYPSLTKRKFIKRKRALLKKAVELSEICDQDIFLVMVDRKTKEIV